MEPISAKDFLEQLNSGKMQSGGKLFGIVKKSDKESELLFAFKGESMNWINIPVSMIDHVHLIKQFSWEGEKLAKVKIRLKEPSNAEAKVLFELLSGLSEKMLMIWEKKKMMMMGSGMSGGWKKEHHCGHQSGMSCSHHC